LALENPPSGRTKIIVAQDGSGTYRTIQEAINAVPPNNTEHVLIFVKKGTYNEKLFITTSHLSLVGEDRDSTRIVYAELRSNWVKAHGGNDWGSAVVNIGDGVTDLVLANLTVYNNYGSLYGSHDHQFAIRGFAATRIALLYCALLADGGDTVALWDTSSGLYYHANCCFEGWVDYVCPRGWFYITESKFFGHNVPSASIWHDGSANKDQKFVIRHSSFDGVPGFPLGRHHRDAQIYLLDCTFSKNMADRPIHAPKSPNTVPWVWGERHYFHNCHREGGDFAWFSDNLEIADGSPSPAEVTAACTFGGRWDPERTLPPVLPFASIPRPRDDEYGVSPVGATLRWIPGRDALVQKVYFGETNSPPLVSSQAAAAYETGPLQPSTTYYWRVDAVTADEVVNGPLWQFKTAPSDSSGALKMESK